MERFVWKPYFCFKKYCKTSLLQWFWRRPTVDLLSFPVQIGSHGCGSVEESISAKKIFFLLDFCSFSEDTVMYCTETTWKSSNKCLQLLQYLSWTRPSSGDTDLYITCLHTDLFLPTDQHSFYPLTCTVSTHWPVQFVLYSLTCTVCTHWPVQFVPTDLYSLYPLTCTVCTQWPVQFVPTDLYTVCTHWPVLSLWPSAQSLLHTSCTACWATRTELQTNTWNRNRELRTTIGNMNNREQRLGTGTVKYYEHRNWEQQLGTGMENKVGNGNRNW